MPYVDLANAIILRAIDDYRIALKGKKITDMLSVDIIKDCETFFKSDWFKVLTNVDGEFLIRKIREEVKNERAEQN